MDGIDGLNRQFRLVYPRLQIGGDWGDELKRGTGVN